MKTFKKLAILVLCLGLLFGGTSCLIQVREDNGRHHGYHKSSNNHHKHDSPKPGKSHGKPRR